jgi:hypothetical protein
LLPYHLENNKMGNFDFKAFIAKQKEEERLNRGERIVRESHKRILLKERLSSTNRADEMEFMIENIMFDWACGKDILEEGVWSKMKYYGAKTLGSWEKGGGIWGRGERQAKAKAQYEKMLEKTAGGIVKKFMAQIEKNYPEFPNMEHDEKFGEALADIYTFYDSIKHAALTPDDVEGKPISVVQKAIDGGKIDVMMANSIIYDLRVVLSKALDYDLADVYKHFDENKQSEDGDEVLDEISDFEIKEGWEEEVERQAAEDRGETPDDVLSGAAGGDSASWKSLKSNMLPVLLAMGGAGGILMRILVNAGWFTSLFDQLVQNPTPAAVQEFGGRTLTNITPLPGEGFTHMIGRFAGVDLGPNASLGDLFDAMNSIGLDPASGGELAELSGDAAAFAADYGETIGAAGGDLTTPLGEVFGANGGLGIAGNLGLKLGKSAVIAITKEITKEVGKGAAKGAGVAGAAGALGITAPVAASLLTVMGVTGIAAAAGVKALRLKGQHSSRLEKLQRLRNAMDDLQGSPIETGEDPGGDPGEDPGGDPGEEPPTTDDPLLDFKVGDFVIVKNKKGREILTTVAEMPDIPRKDKGKDKEDAPGEQPKAKKLSREDDIASRLVDLTETEKDKEFIEEGQWDEEGIIFITGGDWSIPLGGRRGYNSKGQKWIAIKDDEVQIRKAEGEDFTRAVETDSKIADKMGVDKIDHEAEFEDDEQQNVEYSKFQARLANDKRIWDEKGRATISPGEMTKIFRAVKKRAAGLGHFQRFIMHGTDQGAGAKVDGDFLPDASKTADSLDEAKVQDLELKGVINLLSKEIVPKLKTNIDKKTVMAAIVDSLIKANLLITHKGKRLKKSPTFGGAPTDDPEMDVPKGEMGKGPKPARKFQEILRRINERLKKANKKLITESQLRKYLKIRKRKLLE